MSRVIQGLRWVKVMPARRPEKGLRLSVTQKMGLRYEREVRGALPGSWGGVWFEFCDSNGYGRCQPDVMVWWNGAPLVVECKLTYTDDAWGQLRDLYLPIVAMWTGEQVRGVQVTRGLRPEAAPHGPTAEFDSGNRLVHWLGPKTRARLSTRLTAFPAAHVAELTRMGYVATQGVQT